MTKVTCQLWFVKPVGPSSFTDIWSIACRKIGSTFVYTLFVRFGEERSNIAQEIAPVIEYVYIFCEFGPWVFQAALSKSVKVEKFTVLNSSICETSALSVNTQAKQLAIFRFLSQLQSRSFRDLLHQKINLALQEQSLRPRRERIH